MIKDLIVEKIDLKKPAKLKIAIVQSTYHAELNGNMTNYCKEVLIQNDIPESNIKVYYAPGSWEVPLIVEKLAKSKQFDAIVAFSIIIKGDTYHFDMIANEVTRALMNTAINYQIPVGFEILAVNTFEQAEARASNNNYNKGIEAGNAILKTLKTLREIA
ncbi:MAG: 6,7-dimethyl-8-ribityllumazine synthase [Methylococcaceae bacterium]|nr:6,7-dimethyl-8-ribityllumazine synthase [Methylococcaceae bacterium]MDD1607607.1 6,7-dimethyl-8-ribityllumazine synthase [Methylococcaceae bacterium]MDD1610312.1 6,7-dimethyl-8-ribityllumazine synthase [Methylococcaceae bacterium]MDD1615843.1 6,7-dimethyl-8-ribityllumazine synthase [Methylococcaceae bacterium]OYV19286.1 MAG: 6,7-dimethyl-8-ribityllumazine synthase [Methylococcaceae bacterium NSP1-2]